MKKIKITESSLVDLMTKVVSEAVTKNKKENDLKTKKLVEAERRKTKKLVESERNKTKKLVEAEKKKNKSLLEAQIRKNSDLASVLNEVRQHLKG